VYVVSMRRFFFWAAVLPIGFAAAACGGKVVHEEGAYGAGGAGASGSTSSSATSTANTTTTSDVGQTSGQSGVTSSGTGGSDPEALCAAVCEQYGELGCFGPSDQCIVGCVQAYKEAPLCTTELSDYLNCLIEALPVTINCGATECIDASSAFETCVGSCGDVTCSGASDGSCSCKGDCGGEILSTECAPIGDGTTDCNCYVDGALVAICNEAFPECDLEASCCADFF